MRARHSESLAERLDSYSIPEPNSGCILWTGGALPQGYGRLRYKGRDGLAHRFSWQAHRGPIPGDMLVCHKCDVPSCINPNHLFLGTYADNSADMVRKNRQVKGQDVPQSKLTPEQVLAIRRDARRPVADVAAQYGINRSMVGFIRRREWWAHLDERSV